MSRTPGSDYKSMALVGTERADEEDHAKESSETSSAEDSEDVNLSSSIRGNVYPWQCEFFGCCPEPESRYSENKQIHWYVLEFFFWTFLFFFGFGYSWASKPVTYNSVALAIFVLIFFRCYCVSQRVSNMEGWFEGLGSFDEEQWPTLEGTDVPLSPATIGTWRSRPFLANATSCWQKFIASIIMLISGMAPTSCCEACRRGVEPGHYGFHYGYPGSWLALLVFAFSSFFADVILWHMMMPTELDGWGLISTCDDPDYRSMPDWPWPYYRGLIWLIIYPAIGNVICEAIFRLINLGKRLSLLRSLIGYRVKDSKTKFSYRTCSYRVKELPAKYKTLDRHLDLNTATVPSIDPSTVSELRNLGKTWIRLFEQLNFAGKMVTPLAEQTLLMSMAIMAGNLAIGMYSYFVQKNKVNCWSEAQFMVFLISHFLIFGLFAFIIMFYCLRVNRGFDILITELAEFRSRLLLTFKPDPNDDLSVFYFGQALEAQIELMKMQETKILLFGFPITEAFLAKLFGGLIPIIVGAMSFISFPRFPENNIGYLPGEPNTTSIFSNTTEFFGFV